MSQDLYALDSDEPGVSVFYAGHEVMHPWWWPICLTLLCGHWALCWLSWGGEIFADLPNVQVMHSQGIFLKWAGWWIWLFVLIRTWVVEVPGVHLPTPIGSPLFPVVSILIHTRSCMQESNAIQKRYTAEVLCTRVSMNRQKHSRKPPVDVNIKWKWPTTNLELFLHCCHHVEKIFSTGTCKWK